MNSLASNVSEPRNETLVLDTTPSRPDRQQCLPQEIPGVDTWILSVPESGQEDVSVPIERQVIYFVLEGGGVASTGGQKLTLNPMTLFVPKPGEVASFLAGSPTVFLQILMDLTEDESASLDDSLYPMVQEYQACEKYRDYFKSEKTVSRTLVHPFTLPRFCMGSVETTGPDRIEPHAHPMLDQLFYSFAENDCTLLVDGASFRYGPTNLLHIPLGSDHGVDAVEGDVVHYLWLDFFENAEEMQYLVEVHKPVED